MTGTISQQQDEINREIDGVYNRLEDLEGEEAGISEELKQLDTQSHRFAVLREVSDQLEKLEKLGGSDLFWGENYEREAAFKDQKRVRDLVTNYDSRLLSCRLSRIHVKMRLKA